LWILSQSSDEKNFFAKDETTAEYIGRKALLSKGNNVKHSQW
jgi:hypothetical protein